MWYIRTDETRCAIRIDFAVEGEQVRLSSEYETVLFRITQEALTNIVKYAHASHAMVRLEMNPEEIQLTVRDDGIGFDPEKVLGEKGKRTGWGLLGIKERTLLLGGQYEIDSAPEQGVKIQVSIALIGEVTDAKDTAITG